MPTTYSWIGEEHDILSRLRNEPRLPLKAALRVKRVSSRKELERAFAIRLRVFVREQGVPKEIEMDRDDKRAFHFLAFEGKNGRNGAGGNASQERQDRTHGGAEKLSSERRRNEAIEASHREAKKQGAQKIYLHAQVPVIGFYEAWPFGVSVRFLKKPGFRIGRWSLRGDDRTQFPQPTLWLNMNAYHPLYRSSLIYRAYVLV